MAAAGNRYQSSWPSRREWRQCWRVFAHVVKAKLEAIESGITTLEEVFRNPVVVAGADETVGERLIPVLRHGKPLPSRPPIEAKAVALPAGKCGAGL